MYKHTTRDEYWQLFFETTPFLTRIPPQSDQQSLVRNSTQTFVSGMSISAFLLKEL